MTKPILEICAATPSSVIAAVEGCADRVELCSALSEGGVTPSVALISFATERIPTHVLIRPRCGDFLYNDAEKEVMISDIRTARNLGAKGIAIGALTADGGIDMNFMRRVMDVSDGISVTFHRAFDMVREPESALEDIISLGCNRVLTSGLAATAEQGIEKLRELAGLANGRIIVMPASGVCPENVVSILLQTGAREIHASASMSVRSLMQWKGSGASMGNPAADEFIWKETSAEIVHRLRHAIDET